MNIINLEQIATVLAMSLKDVMMDRDISNEQFADILEENEKLKQENEVLKKANKRLRDLGEDNINLVIQN